MVEVWREPGFVADQQERRQSGDRHDVGGSGPGKAASGHPEFLDLAAIGRIDEGILRLIIARPGIEAVPVDRDDVAAEFLAVDESLPRQGIMALANAEKPAERHDDESDLAGQ